MQSRMYTKNMSIDEEINPKAKKKGVAQSPRKRLKVIP